MITDQQRCLAEEEIYEVASDPSPRPELVAHVTACPSCQTAVERTRQQVREIREFVDDEVFTSLKRDSHFATLKISENDKGCAGSPKSRTRETSRLIPGQALGKYIIQEFLDRGGMGEVYRVSHPELPLSLVAKICRDSTNTVLPPEQLEMRERLLRDEARTLARLSEAHSIARIYDLGQSDFGPYLVMEMVAGRSLRQCANEFKNAPDKLIRLMVAIADAADEAHRVGIVHGDLKPENVVISPQGEPKLIDFGLARIRDAWQKGQNDRTSGGTPAYMAPEQASANSPSVTPATDVFALGAILHELAVDSQSHGGSEETSDFHPPRKWHPIEKYRGRTSDPQIDSIVRRCLAADPAARFQSGGALAEALRGIGAGTTSGFSNGRRLIAAIALLGALVSAVIWAIRSGFQPHAIIDTSEQIPGLLGSDVAAPGQLHESLPLTTGNTVFVSTLVPENQSYLLAWIDHEGRVSVFAEDGTDYGLSLTPIDERRQKRLEWPATGEVPVVGAGGTEMVLVVGSKKLGEDQPQRLQQQLQTMISKGHWPSLPDNFVVRCSRDDVRCYSDEGTPRGPGELKDSPLRTIISSSQLIRQKLRADYEFLRGEAFLVYAPATNPQW
jgi:serine/threonine protein kinase